MSEAILESRTLANGTTLTLCDASRRQAADRWIAARNFGEAFEVIINSGVDNGVKKEAMPQ